MKTLLCGFLLIILILFMVIGWALYEGNRANKEIKNLIKKYNKKE